MKIKFLPRSSLGKYSIGLIILMPILFYIGMSFVDFYKSIPGGETILKENDEGDALYIIVSGSVKVTKGSDGQVTLVTLQERDYFGEMTILDREPRSASVEAQEETRLLVINQDDFQRLLPVKSQIVLPLLRTLSRRLREINAKFLEGQT